MKKGDILEGTIEQYDFPNKGSFMLEDRKVTIKGAFPGQKVRFMVTKKKSKMAEGRVLEVLERAVYEDVEPACPYFGDCGGCSYRTMSYGNQLTFKENMVKKLLDRVLLGQGSNSKDYTWEGILASPVTQGYRNKMEFTFGDAYKDGPMALGLHKKGSFYDILNIDGCAIIGADWSRIVAFTQHFFDEKKVPYYHRMRHEGILRNLVVRQSAKTGEFLINLVAATQWENYGFTAEEILGEYVEGLLALAKTEGFAGSIAGILYTENNTLGDVVQCDKLHCLYGTDFIVEQVMGLDFKISPFSFFQTNTKGCEVLYAKAREYILSGSVMADADGKKADKVVFDLYSGTGTIAQMMAPAAKKVIGIEIVEEAVEAAKENAALNGLSNCEFIAGDVLKAIDLVEDKPDVIILDPPRDGIHPKALEKILSFGVDEMIYISCKPTSLARDLETIIQRGYKVEKACCVDQFPFTEHVETVCLLSKKCPV
ncbi:MAG: 23S rRNA (uracil(1939)-C(5))-methyltransferase RlmD [Wujia sp.]